MSSPHPNRVMSVPMHIACQWCRVTIYEYKRGATTGEVFAMVEKHGEPVQIAFVNSDGWFSGVHGFLEDRVDSERILRAHFHCCGEEVRLRVGSYTDLYPVDPGQPEGDDYLHRHVQLQYITTKWVLDDPAELERVMRRFKREL